MIIGEKSSIKAKGHEKSPTNSNNLLTKNIFSVGFWVIVVTQNLFVPGLSSGATGGGWYNAAFLSLARTGACGLSWWMWRGVGGYFLSFRRRESIHSFSGDPSLKLKCYLNILFMNQLFCTHSSSDFKLVFLFKRTVSEAQEETWSQTVCAPLQRQNGPDSRSLLVPHRQ